MSRTKPSDRLRWYWMSFWLVTKRAFSYFDPNSPPKYYIHWGGIRMLVLMTCFVWGWAAKMMVEEERDFDMPYPNKDQLIIQQGLLTQGKGKGTRLLFKSSDGAIQRIHPSGVFDFLKTEWFRGRYDKPVWREAKIASFKMPSGYAWLAELRRLSERGAHRSEIGFGSVSREFRESK